MVIPEVVTETEIVTTYEPTVQDKIQRIIYRLEHGEKLVSGKLYDGKNFCVLGLFADESGVGHWQESRYDDDVYRYRTDNHFLVTSLDNSELMDYYDFRTFYDPKQNDTRGQLGSLTQSTGSIVAVALDQVSNDIANKIKCLRYEIFNHAVAEQKAILHEVNDIGLKVGYEGLNQLLADIIRSGALFNSHAQED